MTGYKKKEATAITDFAEVVGRASERWFGYTPTDTFLASLKYDASLTQTGGAQANEYGPGAYADEPAECTFNWRYRLQHCIRTGKYTG
eukprot:1902473-Amphidinium_carterae.1